eukprot:TRINITY_DN2585_c0_g2_i2.p1 TRINITY_DN2585_c0_g2~~TRINITY_DN2585_c0_g2_i2.p1  ORF type:complete len:501 (-),score=71.26 TRINITY_DN2585_c0_g2_i2:641-2143(-)
MADATKYFQNHTNVLSNMKAFFSVVRTRRSVVFAYGCMLSFIAFTIFLAFNPNGSSSPWLNNFFTSNSMSEKSQFSSFFSYFFPNSQSSVNSTEELNTTRSFNHSPESPERKEIVGRNQSDILNSTHSLVKEERNGTGKDLEKGKKEKLKMGSLKKCDIFDGQWVRDDSYPLYREGSCSFIDEQYNCFLNGRPDRDYQKLRWQPNGCNIPRLNATDMLERLRGRRLVFVGDSLNRNMWESLVCILKNSIKNKTQVYEASGKHEFRTQKFYSFVFEDYNCSVEFFWSPFLVQEWEIAGVNGTTKETLRLDLIEKSSSSYKQADIIIFNTGHWWTHERTSKGKDYYQEGSHVYEELNVVEAFRKALTTWGRWVDANVHPNRTLVFFRGYSATHFSGGRWNSGGQCNTETEPIKNVTYLDPYPSKMTAFESVMRGMKTPLLYLNITRMTDYRKDGHPSVYRKQNLTQEERRSPERFQDCSHWCLPGVPDAWNELLYAKMRVML